MWRCHCGETNLNTHTHCRECSGARRTHEDRDAEHHPRERQKTVYMGFFGMGMPEPRESDVPRRILTEDELEGHFRRESRERRIMWFLYAVAAVAVILILVWQVTRKE